MHEKIRTKISKLVLTKNYIKTLFQQKIWEGFENELFWVGEISTHENIQI